MKKRNSHEKLLDLYREQLKKYITEEEVRVALEQPVQYSLSNVRYYSAYYHGACTALRTCMDWWSEQIKTKERAYVRASLALASQSPRHTEMFLQGQTIAYRNHVKRGGKLVSCEAYFVERIEKYVEVE